MPAAHALDADTLRGTIPCMDDFETRWQRIQDQLRIQASGSEQPPFSSGRTIFGIQSTAEKQMEHFARQIDDENKRKLKDKKPCQ